MVTTQALLKERYDTHGDFQKQFSLSQLIKGAIAEHGTIADPVVAEAFDHIIVKLSRAAVGDAMHLDHWKDLEGYAALVVKHLQEPHPARAGFVIEEVIAKEYKERLRHPMTKRIAYTDGGGWFDFIPGAPMAANWGFWPVYAIEFEDGSVWDIRNGWRTIP